MRVGGLAGFLALSGPAILYFGQTQDVQAVEDPAFLPATGAGQHLAVIVPVYRGDLSRAVSSLDRWPSTCSPLTERNADLVLYYAEGEEDAPAVIAAVETITETAGRCFAKTRLVYAHLTEEEDIYPKGPSVMFFKMFLDEGVRSELSEYDALVIVEWDVLVASDRSFEELHHAAFRGNEDFWMKGSNLGGTSFHSAAQASDMWNMLGHINGNAIYNNNDPAFVEFIDYTRTRWDYTYPYDVALWLTISDFPYSWPLWQRYSSNFVTTNLISYVGFEHVDNTTVSDAIAGETLFIHGSRVEEGNLASLKATKHERKQVHALSRRVLDDTEAPPAVCSAACGNEDAADLPVGTSTVCDDTCDGDSARFGGFLCGAGDSDKFGYMCRLCYVDIEEARREEQLLELTRSDLGGLQGMSHVIMCNTMRPPEAAECSNKCERKKNTVCDESCGTGRHGDYNCNWRDHGATCRFCFDDLEAALMADNVAQRRGGRVIMCSTFEPPQPKERPEPEDLQTESQPRWPSPPNLGDWEPSEKWDEGCCDEVKCPYTSKDGTRGRVCDHSCETGQPYGTKGCNAKKGKYGYCCRACYNDRDKAIKNDEADNRAIMCDNVLPISAYRHRRLSASVTESAPGMMSLVVAEMEGAQSMFADATVLPYVNDLVRSNLCAFVAGRADEISQVEVAVMSVLQFLPGMTVAVAADHEGFDAYERAVGGLPGVTVHSTEDPFTASLFADKFCGVDTSLVFYMQPGSVVSRQFSSKDTHSTHGDLLVVHGNAKLSYVDRELAKQTTAVLGFVSPSFTFNTDLFLPVGANADLREVLVSGLDTAHMERSGHEGGLEAMKSFMDLHDMSVVPQVMAALAYSRNTPGVWFVDPETWVSQHLFRTASIWDIPLVKPRYTCTIDQSAIPFDLEDIDVGLILQNNLDFFSKGGTCDSGFIDIPLGD